MICTEAEAKFKWCPQARELVRDFHHDTPVGAANREGRQDRGPRNCNCIGSECMLWDWVDYDFETASEYVGPSYQPNTQGHERAEQRLVDGWQEYEHHDKNYRGFKRPMGERRRGTCGLIRSSE